MLLKMVCTLINESESEAFKKRNFLAASKEHYFRMMII